MSEKLCECGCGLPAPLYTQTNANRGQFKGQPARFRPGHNAKRISTPEAFWAKVNKNGPNECWEWTGSLLRHGYGQV